MRLTGAALLGVGAASARAGAEDRGAGAPEHGYRLPPGVMPDLGCWFWKGEEAFRPRAYREFLEAAARHSPYGLLTASLRAPNAEITRPEVREGIAQAVAYARELGLGVVMDLDVRLARRAFQDRYPEELQEMLRLRELGPDAPAGAELRIESEVLNDHYTGGGAEPYLPVSGRFLRAYAYVREAGGIDAGTVEEVTEACEVLEASPRAVRVRVPPGASGRTICVMAAFRHLTPDVFAAHLLKFQRQLLEQYAEIALAGVCKDEWGFPPCFDGHPRHDDFWYSEARRAAYARQTGGRDLLRDCLLMYAGELGRKAEREAVINRFLRMSTRRNAAVERHFHRVTKEVFGPKAISATHATWFPYPGVEEFRKNGLHWWQAPRDWAQTDEVTPYCVRTALAKKWDSAVWYNMYYSPRMADYERGIWSYALAGGRMNCHPLYPLPAGSDHYELMRGGLMHGISRIRLLNLVSDSPLDCPVAVVFGHACAMNWAGPHYGDAGVEAAEAFWRRGYPADLIPSSEIANRALRTGSDGAVWYGRQRYAAVLLYHPQYEGESTAAFVAGAWHGGGTMLTALGAWTRDFEGRDFDGEAALAGVLRPPHLDACVERVVAHLEGCGILPQTPASVTVGGFRREIASPPAAGHCRLIDGTCVRVAGAERAEGDPIVGNVDLAGCTVSADAVGLIAARFGGGGRLEAVVAGGLKAIRIGELALHLESRADVALWRDRLGRWRGAVQDLEGQLPADLANVTGDWLRLSSPPPLP